jgi:hypothetical protein
MRFMQQVKNVISMKNQLLLPDSFQLKHCRYRLMTKKEVETTGRL